MFSCTTFGIFFGSLLLIVTIPDAASYTKYGRTCKDIGCRSDEMCVMAEDPCTGYTDKCGRYPTCRRTSDASCTTMVCGENEYCKNENGVPKCVRKSTGLVLPYAEDDEIEARTVPKRQSGYPTESETHGSSDTSKNSDGHSDPTRSSGYPSSGSSGYPSSGSSGYSSSGSSGYPSSGSSSYPSSRSSGYPSSGSSGYPSSRSSGYPSSGSSGYPSSGSSGYPSSGSSSGSSGYPSSGSSGYPSSGSSGYPSSGSSGYPSSGSSSYPSSGSGHPSSQNSGYPSHGSSSYPSSGSSGYPSRGSSGYPTGSGYPSSHSGSSGYPDNSRNPTGEETVRRTGASTVNAGYPNYPRTSAYPEGNPSYRGNYPAQNAGYPSSGYPNSNQHPPQPNQGYPYGYPQSYPQGGYYPGGQNYMTTTKRPGIRDQLTNFARNMAEKVLTQTIVDRVTGRH